MKCPFCKEFSETYDDGPYKIYSCTNHQDWLIEYPEPNPLGNWIGISNDNYLIELIVDDNKTALYDLKNLPNDPDDHSCLRINYLIDANPHNAQEWINRLLKLKAFS